jgi:hypothetical protein
MKETMSEVNKKPESFWQTFHHHNFKWDQVTLDRIEITATVILDPFNLIAGSEGLLVTLSQSK